VKFTSAAVLVGLLALGLFVVSGCQQQAEQAQTAAEETAEVAADMATDAAETAGDMAEEAGEMAGEMAEDAGEMAEDVATKTGDVAQRAAQLAAHGKALDPTCGMVVDMEGAPTVEHEGVTFYFCSDSCAAKFQQDPAKYLPGS
jgi:xanthine dehydrogenase accessory factor